MHASWPAAGSSVIRLTESAPGRAAGAEHVALRALGPSAVPLATGRSRSTPVFAQRAGMAGAGVSKVDVTVFSHARAVAAGVRGVLVTVRAAAGSAGGLVRLGISYAGFAQISGGYYGADLGLTELPACALVTPHRPMCQRGRPLASVNDWAVKTVSAQVRLAGGRPGHAPGRPVVIVVADTLTDGGGAGGNPSATSLSPSGTWAAGGSSGSFTYSYPMAVPPAAGGLEPALSLNYDSGTVDGETADAQPQPSWIGDGWTLPQSYVEQSFIPCQDKPEGTASPQATQDECYNGPVLTLSMNGGSDPLVCPTSTFSYTSASTCAASAYQDEVITHHVSSGNGQGTQFTDYWTVTTRDGTTYYFGLNHLPGWDSTDAATNSVDSVPVFSAHTGDPCYSSSGFTVSACTMAYRWNLDYVTDVHGNAMAYYYKKATNAYDQYGSSGAVSYDRDSYLQHIDYGFTDGNAYTGNVPDQVQFGTGDRCFAANCDPISTYYSNWPDVPYQQDNCSAGASGCPKAPTFWSEVALTSVTTQQWNGSKYVPADSWALTQTLPKQTDLTANLWLKSIAHNGLDTTAGGAAAPLPAVTFTPVEKANRVNPGTNPFLYRNRIGQITTETGSVTTIAYELPDACTPGSSSYPPAPSGNTMSCFPEYWGTFLPNSTNGADWFNKWAVGSVQQSDPAGHSPGLFNSYSYSSPAWHYDDNEVVQPQYRTYGQWRGYQDVITYSGNSDPRTENETTYYQGMSDDNNTTSVMLPDSQGGQHADVNQLAGDVLETTRYDYGSTTSTPLVNNSQIYSYWVSGAYMTRTRAGLPDLTANATGQVERWTRQAITDSSPATWRETETDTRFFWATNSPYFGLPEYTYAHGDLSQPTLQTCTTTTYAPVNSALNLVGLPAETEVDAAACTGSNPSGKSAPGSGEVNQLTGPTNLNFTNSVISDTRTFYDNKPLATTWPQPASPTWPQAAPGNNDVSVVQKATGYNSGAFTYQTTAASVYDTYGRVTASYDGNGGFNGSAYTPTKTKYTMTNGSTTEQDVTNPLSQTVTTQLDPLRGLPVETTDPNGISTTLQYDVLGRLTSVWEYSRPTTATPNVSYSYSVPGNGPTVVTTQRLNDAGGQVTSTALYDSLLRVRQTQVPTPQGGMLVTDHLYDSHGWEQKTNINWLAAGNPGSSILSSPADSQVPEQIFRYFDGLGRPVKAISYDDSAVRSTTYTQYTGDKVITVPASGATPQAVTTDALGRETELDQYTSPPSVSTGTEPPGDQSGFTTVTVTGGSTQATSYRYTDVRGWLSGIKDVTTGEDWFRTYNQLGQVITSEDPNAGTSSMTYDADGHLTSTTNADGKTISYTYDPLGRKTGEFDGPSSASPPIAAWVYDNSNNAVPGMTNPIGQVTTETSYDSSANKYTIQQQGFNAFGEPAGETVTIPATTAAGALGGQYTLTHQYTATTGLPLSDTYPASPAGAALPAETVQYGYCTGFDLPCTLSSKITENGLTKLYGYTQNTTYTDLFQIGQEEIGSAASNAFITSTYDPNTGKLDDSQVSNSSGSVIYDDTSYQYDPAGNITSQADERNGTQTEVQCFSYNTLDQLKTAWTTDGTHACSAGPSTGTSGTVGDGISGAAYWTSWAYNVLGDQTTQTQHSVTGGTSTVTTYTYNGGNGTSTGQPDTLTQAATTGPGAGTATYTYDPAGNTLTRALPSGNQTLTWYDDGKLATDNTTTYIYDADGNLLLQEDPSQTTLYVFGQQFVLTGSGVAGTRFLSMPGGGAVVRTGDGTSYSFELPDQHGTSLLTLDHTAASPVWRQFTPFGAPRGKATGTWPDTNGFLGDPTGTGTGLTTIGARQYDPGTGRFLSIDPILEQNSPQQLNGYTYAADNPVTNSDPTGMVCAPGASSNANCNDQPVQSPPPPTYSYTAGNIFISTTSLPVLVNAVAKAAKQIGIYWYPGGDTGTSDINDPQFKYAIAQSVCASHPNWCAQFPLPGQSGLGKIIQTLGMILIGGLGEGEAGDPVPEPGSLSPLEARQFYLAGERHISARAAELVASEVSPEERANILFFMRNDLRTQTRDSMADRQLAEGLEVTDPNMTLEQIIAKYQARGLSGDDLWNAISDAASRSRPSINKFFGLEP